MLNCFISVYSQSVNDETGHLQYPETAFKHMHKPKYTVLFLYYVSIIIYLTVPIYSLRIMPVVPAVTAL